MASNPFPEPSSRIVFLGWEEDEGDEVEAEGVRKREQGGSKEYSY